MNFKKEWKILTLKSIDSLILFFVKAAAGFLGIKPTSSREHLVRAMLESLVYRVAQVLRAVDEETSCTYSRIR